MSKTNETKTRILSLLRSGVLPTGVIEHIAKLSSPQTLVSCGQDRTIKLWDICTGECKRTLTGHSDTVTCIAPYKGRVFFTGSNDCTVRQWDGATGRCINVFRGHTHYVRCICTLTHRKVPLVVSGSRDKTIIAWRICASHGAASENEMGADCVHPSQIEAVIRTGGIFGVTALAAAKNDSVIISGDADGHVRMWDTESWREIPTGISGHSAAVEAIKVVELGHRTLVVTCGGDGDRSARVWDMETGECLNTFRDHVSGVWSADFVSKGSDGEVELLTVSDSEAFVRQIYKTKRDDSEDKLTDLFGDMEPSWKTFTQINAVAFAQYCDPDAAAAWGEKGGKEVEKEEDYDDDDDDDDDDETSVEKIGTPSNVRKSGKRKAAGMDKKKEELDMCPVALARGKKIFLWSFPQMRKELELVGHTGLVYGLCFLPSE